MSCWCRLVACGLAALAFARSPLHGQAPSERDLHPSEKGSVVRARMQSPDGPRVLEGSLKRAGRDSLVVDTCRWINTCRRVALPASSVAGLAVYRGRPGSIRGVLAVGFFGLLSGAALGGAAGMIGCGNNDMCFTPYFAAAGGALVGLAGGMAAGAAMTPERWEVVRDYPPRP